MRFLDGEKFCWKFVSVCLLLLAFVNAFDFETKSFNSAEEEKSAVEHGGKILIGAIGFTAYAFLKK